MNETIPASIRNLIIDFGGVLFAIDYDAPVRAFAALGFTDFDAIYTQAAQSELFDQLETGRADAETFYQFVESKCPGATRQQVVDAWNSILLHVWPEKVAFVKALREKGFRTFMLSNTNAIHVSEFERMIDETMGVDHLYDAFEKIHYSNVIGIKKPYPETYLQVCAWHGLKPEETLFIDDSIQHVEGARKAGLFAVHLEKGHSIEDVLAELLTR